MMRSRGRGTEARARRTAPPLLAAGLVLLAATSPLSARAFVPTEARAVSLVRGRRMAEFATIAQVLAYAERARPGGFKVARFAVERRPREAFDRVRICYWLGPSRRPEAVRCGIGYAVSDDPPHVDLLNPETGLGRELEHSRAQFLRALDREIDLARDPAAERLRDALAPVNPYDER